MIPRCHHNPKHIMTSLQLRGSQPSPPGDSCSGGARAPAASENRASGQREPKRTGQEEGTEDAVDDDEDEEEDQPTLMLRRQGPDGPDCPARQFLASAAAANHWGCSATGITEL
eukprot:869530-Pyramimonas_sp.AAC.1